MSRAAVIEALVGLVVAVTGVAMISVAAALILGGSAITAFAVLPLFKRGG